jgi:hypothetical protein
MAYFNENLRHFLVDGDRDLGQMFGPKTIDQITFDRKVHVTESSFDGARHHGLEFFFIHGACQCCRNYYNQNSLSFA